MVADVARLRGFYPANDKRIEMAGFCDVEQESCLPFFKKNAWNLLYFKVAGTYKEGLNVILTGSEQELWHFRACNDE